MQFRLHSLKLHALTALVFSLFAISVFSQSSNGVLHEVWLNITGANVADLTNNSAFPSNPSFVDILTNGFESPINVYDH